MEEAPSPIRPLTHPSCSLGNCDGVGLPRALGERIARLGEMVEADADVACLGDPLRGRLELREALGGSWQRILGQERLMPLHPGHVGVAEKEIRSGSSSRARHRRNDVLDGLERQAVHEIEVERLIPAWRSHSATRRVCAKDWMRPIVCCTAGSSSGRPGLPGSRSPPSAPRYGLERSSEGRSRRRSRRRPRCRGARQPDASGAGSPNLSGSSESRLPNGRDARRAARSASPQRGRFRAPGDRRRPPPAHTAAPPWWWRHPQ